MVEKLPGRIHRVNEQEQAICDANLTRSPTQWSFGRCAYLASDTVTPDAVEEVPYVGLEHIGQGSLSISGRGTSSDVTSAKARFRSGDILFGKLRPYFRKVAQVRFDGICSTDIWVVRAKEGVDQKYLFYLMASSDFVEFATLGSEGTRMPRAQWGHVSRFQVRLPSLPEQCAVAHILSALDDKIELNRRMNETLEAMARAIFKDWFVDFGPTRAKAEGRAPYLASEFWDLFPDALDDEGKPAGWEYGTLADVTHSPRHGVNPADVPEKTPYIGLEHMPRRSIALSDWGDAGKVKSNKTRFYRGDILFGKLRPYFHKVGAAPLEGICSTDIAVVVPRAQEWHVFAIACLSSDDFVRYTNRTSTGTKMPRTSWKTMAQYKICLPSEEAVCAFQGTARPLLDRLGDNIHESSTLAKTRDLLLPKLISGEIRLRDAEEAVEAVT